MSDSLASMELAATGCAGALHFAELTNEVREIVALGETGKLRHVVKPHVHKPPDA